MRKKIIIPIIIVLVILIFAIGYFVGYKILNKSTVEIENPYYENIGELATIVNEKYGVSLNDRMIIAKDDYSFAFSLKSLDDKNNYYYEDNLVYTKYSLDDIEEDEIIKLIANYLKVTPQDLILTKNEENIIIEHLDKSWKILNSIDGDTFTLALIRLTEETDVDFVSYKINDNEKYYYSKNHYSNSDFRMKQTPNIVSFDLLGEKVDNINIKEIDELFEGSALDFIKESLNRYQTLPLDYTNRKEYFNIFDSLGIKISGIYNYDEKEIKKITLIQLK